MKDLLFPNEKYRLGRNDPPVPSTFDGTPWPHRRWYLSFFFTTMIAKFELTTNDKRLVKYLGVLVQSKQIDRGVTVTPPRYD